MMPAGEKPDVHVKLVTGPARPGPARPGPAPVRPVAPLAVTVPSRGGEKPDVSQWGLPTLVAVFFAAAALVWIVSVKLEVYTDVLSERWHLGAAVGGLVLLAVANNLPEVAITVSAALSGSLPIAIGNLLGGVAAQTVVLVLVDAVGVPGRRPLTYRAASMELVLEGLLLIAVLTIVVGGNRLPEGLRLWRVDPATVLLTVVWAAGLVLHLKARHGLPWQRRDDGDGEDDGGDEETGRQQGVRTERSKVPTVRAVTAFTVAALLVLAGGVVLEVASDALSRDLGLSGVVFGATALAFATALPQISSSLAAARDGNYELAVSNVFGGNAFLPVLLLPAALLSAAAVVPQAAGVDIYLTAVGLLLTVVYLVGLLFRPRRRVLRMGPDSLAVLVLYAISLLGLAVIGK
jgi:cation:H+ antiporter